ncbi:753_t:CDS:2, partial [Paraglomus occultum]
GWKKARYGRAVAVMRLRKDDGTKAVFNPQHQNNLKRFTERDLEQLEQMPSDASSSESHAVNDKSDDGLQKLKLMKENQDKMANLKMVSSQSPSIIDGLKQLSLDKNKDMNKKDQNTKAEQVMETDDLPPKDPASTPMPDVSKDVRIEINTDLKQLFGPATAK